MTEDLVTVLGIFESRLEEEYVQTLRVEPPSKWLKFVLVVLVYLLVVARPGSGLAASALPSAEQLKPGDYRFIGQSVFRRIIVSQSRTVKYDVWRAGPNGTLQHSQFDLISPARLPVESDQYQVWAGRQACGKIALHFYRDKDGQVFREFLVLRYNRLEEPLSSGGRPLTQLDYDDDKRAIAQLARAARDSHFYSTLSATAKFELPLFMPQCS